MTTFMYSLILSLVTHDTIQKIMSEGFIHDFLLWRGKIDHVKHSAPVEGWEFEGAPPGSFINLGSRRLVAEMLLCVEIHLV